MTNNLNWPKRNSPRQPWTPQHLDIEGHTYSFNSYGSKKFRRISYRCIHGSRNSKNPCPAMIKVDLSTSNQIVKYILVKDHNCANSIIQPRPYYSNIQIQIKISELYKDDQYSHQADPIYNALLEWIKSTTPANAIKNSISLSTVRSYVRQLINLDPKNKISFDSCKTKDNLNFLLFDIRILDKPIYGFASPAMLNWTKESQIIGIDGTFHSSPTKYYQVLIFVGRTKIMNVPLLFLVLPNKKEATYVCAFNIYFEILKANGIQLHHNVKFVCDFEMAEINAIKSVFIHEEKTIQLCYFHYCKNVNDNFGIIVAKEGFCKFTSDLFLLIKILPFINIESVKKFIKFLPKLSGYSKTANQFIDYFIKTYTMRYRIEDWNVTGKILPNRATNNANESFNRKINSKLKKSPTIVNFFQEIRKIEIEYRNKYDNLLMDNKKIKPAFLNEIDHNEIQIFQEQICKLNNNYKLFAEKIKLQGDMFFGVVSNTREHQICHFKIAIPSYNVKYLHNK